MGLWIGAECVLCVRRNMEGCDDWRAVGGRDNAVHLPYHFCLFCDPSNFPLSVGSSDGDHLLREKNHKISRASRREYFPKGFPDSHERKKYTHFVKLANLELTLLHPILTNIFFFFSPDHRLCLCQTLSLYPLWLLASLIFQ